MLSLYEIWLILEIVIVDIDDLLDVFTSNFRPDTVLSGIPVAPTLGRCVVRFRLLDAVSGAVVTTPGGPCLTLFADPAASCCRLSLPPSLSLKKISRLFLSHLRCVCSYFGVKLGISGLIFRPLGVFVKLRS